MAGVGNCSFVQLGILLLCALSVVETYPCRIMYRAADNQAAAAIAVSNVSSLREV